MVTTYAPEPPEESSPVEVRFGTTQPQRRVTVLFRLILAIPQLIVLYFLTLAAELVTIVGWFAALFTGRLPRSVATFLEGVLRWDVRVIAYMTLLVDRYPPFSLDPDVEYPVDLVVQTGRLNRLAVLFRIILVIPASIVAAVFGFGIGIIAVVVWVITLVLGRLPDPIFGVTAAYLRYRVRLLGFFGMLTSWYPSAILGDGTSESFSGTPPPSVGGVGTAPAPFGPPAAYAPPAQPPAAYAPPPPLPIPSEFGVPTASPSDGAPPPYPNEAQPYPSAPPPPSMGAPEATVRSGGLWPLLLTSAARTWSIVLIAVGVVGLVLYAVLLPITLKSVSSAVARAQVETAYSAAGQAAQSFGSEIKNCTTSAQSSGGNPLSCYEQTTTTAADALQTYADQLASITFPSSAQAQANAAEQAASGAASSLRSLAASPDIQTFSATLQDQAFLNKMNAVDTTYNQLHQALNG